MKTIVTDYGYDNMIQEEGVFDKVGMTYTHLTYRVEGDLIERARGGEIMMTQYGLFNHRVMGASGPELKLILRYGVGANTIDLEVATQLGVRVYDMPDYGTNEVADQAMGMVLGLAHKICETNDYTKHKTRNHMEAIPVYGIPGSTMGIVGFGRISCTFAKRVIDFDCRRIACDSVYGEGSVHGGVEIVTLGTLPKESDIVSVHCPLLPETVNMIGMEASKKVKPTTYLVNTTKGEIANEGDLLTALQEKIVAGAALDVVPEEPMEVGTALFGFDNLLYSPHMAWYSQESALELKHKIVEEAVRFVKGEPVVYPVNHLQRAAIHQTIMLQSAMQQAAVRRFIV